MVPQNLWANDYSSFIHNWKILKTTPTSFNCERVTCSISMPQTTTQQWKGINYGYMPQLGRASTTLCCAKDTILKSWHTVCSRWLEHYRKARNMGMDNVSVVAQDGGRKRLTTMGGRKGLWEEMELFCIKTVLVATQLSLLKCKGFSPVCELHSKKLYLNNCLQKWRNMY